VGCGAGRDRSPHPASAGARLEGTESTWYRRLTDELDFRVLGPLQVAANGVFLPLGGTKQRAVLALLVLHANEVVSADRFIDELWGDSPPKSAANMVQGYVSHLRDVLEPGRARGEHELLVSRPPGYALQIRPEQLDAERFEQLAVEGRRLLAGGDAEAAASTLRAALDLWRGDVLADLAYERFVRADGERLEESRLQVLEDRIDADLAVGNHQALVAELRELVDRYPLRERLRAQLMAALYRCGRQADALEAYRVGRTSMSEKLGIEPGPLLRDLEQAILRQDPSLGAPAPTWIPIRNAIRHRRFAAVGAAVVAAVALVVVLAFGRSGTAGVVVRPQSIAVIDPSRNALADDVPVGAYPGPLAADDELVYVSNIGDATVSMIVPSSRKVSGTGSLSRAIDLVAVREHLWAADGGTAGHTLAPPGTVLDYDLSSAGMRTIRVGPQVEGDEEQTTVAADAQGAEIWAGNKDSETVTQLEPPTMATIHGVAPGGLAAVTGPEGRETIWAGDPGRDQVVRIDGTSRRITGRIPVPGSPSRLSANRRAVWVIAPDHNNSGRWRPTGSTSPAVWRIDPAANRPVKRIALPLTPLRITLGAGSVWVTAQRVLAVDGRSADATVFRIDPRSNRIVARIPLHADAVDGIVVSHGLVWAAVPQSQ
jgi:DNA-binding SARP family transcriptional activator/DNA-binding beta-propeller fold protein YncE